MSDFSHYSSVHKAWKAIEPLIPTWPDLPLPQLRDLHNGEREEIAAEEWKALGHLLRTKTFSLPTRDASHVEARVYQPKDVPENEQLALYVHLHGGAFVFGTIDSEDAVCGRIALGSRVVVLNLNYRHAPEHLYPTAWNDVEDTFEWVHAHTEELGICSDSVILGGASSGAMMAAALTLRQQQGLFASGLPRVAGQVLMIPPLQLPDECFEPQLPKLKCPSGSSFRQNENAPLLTLASLRKFSAILGVRNPNPEDLQLNPGNVSPSHVQAFPPTVVCVAGLDPLRDGGLLYAKLLADEGVPTKALVFKGLPHGFRRFGRLLPSAATKWDRVMEEGVTWILSKPDPSGEFEVDEID